MGDFRIVDPAGLVMTLISRRARGIIAYLALASDGLASRERLCGLFWGDRDDVQARASLRHCLVELRRVSAAADLDLLTIGRERISINGAVFRSDLDDLRAALVGEDAEALSAALAAIGRTRLLEGLEFGGLYRDWLDQTRARIDRSMASGVLAHLGRLEAARDWTGLLRLADAYLQRDPLEEMVVAAAIRADVALGAMASAHRRFHALKSELAVELGVEPGATVRDALAVRAAGGVAAPPVATTARPREPIDLRAIDLHRQARALEIDRDAAPRIALLEQAVAIAPGFADAWGALSRARATQARRGPRPQPFAVLKAGVAAAAEEALRLNPDDGLGHAALSALRPMGQYREREALLRKAHAAAPNDPDVLAALGAFCNHVGFVEEALGLLRRSYELDPQQPKTADVYGAVLYAAGRHQESHALYDIWRKRWPQHLIFTIGPLNTAMCAADWPRYDMLATAARALGSDNSYLRSSLGMGDAMRTGDPDLGPRLAARIGRSLEETGAVPLDLLAAASCIGLDETVFAAIDQTSYAAMYEEAGDDPGGAANPGVIFNPSFSRAMMADVRFLRLCAKLGLCDYWVATDRWPDCAGAVADQYDFKAEARALAARWV